jgi:energy-coupling factor transporter ATP-binding protein EcfA2
VQSRGVLSLPSLRRLDVDGYGLYPGTAEVPGLHVEFQPGLTLTLGANGLGKTTLITILYRLLTGPTEIPMLPAEGTLGSPRLELRTMNAVERATFAARVVDGAKSATASLSFRLGGVDVTVRRRLDTLTLVTWSVDGTQQPAQEEAYQAAVLEHAGLATFSDWILALRHLVFYFEDRRALVWDPSAQRQLLRFLFLPVEQALAWREREREVMTRDSAVRNVTWQYNRELAIVKKAKAAATKSTASQLRDRLAALSDAQALEQERLTALQSALVGVTAERHDATVASLRADDAHESAVWGVERLQLEVIAASFPSATTTARYVLGQILADTSCLVCESDVPAYRRQVEKRLRTHLCPVCGSTADAVPSDAAAAAAALADAIEQVRRSGLQRETAAQRRLLAEEAYTAALDEVAALDATVSARAAEIAEVLRRLPAAEQDMRAHQTELAALGARLEESRRDLEERRAEFDAFVRDVSRAIAARKDAIKQTFDGYAKAFLVESAALTWEPRKDRVGQLGAMVEFPAFALDMSASSFASPVRRSGPDNVSESQREFIDLAFRMALMEVATEGGSTLVVDAPESSIDAVFAARAADVLARFSGRDDNRLLVTSNLVDGNLIPSLLRHAVITEPDDARIVDLLQIASPTAATREYAAEYEQAKARVFGRARES